MVYYKISEERLTGIANQVRRLGKVTGPLTALQMQTILEGIVIPEPTPTPTDPDPVTPGEETPAQ